MSTTTRVAFAGTPQFAVPILRRLIDDGMALVAVYTQPDRPSGRGRRLTPSPVKSLAIECDIPVLQPATLREEAVRDEFRALRPDVLVVAAYGQILPVSILEVPRFGCLNVHASLLPRWRGAAPVARAIEAGDKTTGITIMLMDAGLDTGGILEKSEIEVADADTSATLLAKLANLGAETLSKCLPRYIAGQLEPVAQEEAEATYAPKLLKSEAPIDWGRDAESIRNKIKAFNPWPIAHTHHAGNRIRVLASEISGYPDSNGLVPGSVCAIDKSGVVVVCGRGTLTLTRLQRDHGKPLPARDFLNGYALTRGDRFVTSGGQQY